MTKFEEWVREWRIGPGMNDPRDQVDGLYSGFDGDVEDGWVPILHRLARRLVDLGWDRNLDQVKEKFGTLRFYVGGNCTDAMGEAIAEAEEESARTCERCGAPGTQRGGGWIKTLCNRCAGNRQPL